jgi:Antibiotic biosynthesis monooxygenase
MTAFNAVRFKIKPGRAQEFLDAHRKIHAEWPGLRHVNMIKTGERSYCIIAEWSDMDSLMNARPDMIKTLDSFRDTESPILCPDPWCWHLVPAAHGRRS